MSEPSVPMIPVSQSRQEIAMTRGGVQLTSLEDAFRFATNVARSGLAPKGFDTPEKVLVAIQAGAEAGLSPMQALNSLYVVNGRASWSGDAAKSLIRRAGLLRPGTDFDERIVGDGDEMKAVVIAHRVGVTERLVSEFSVGDAKRANLWNKAGPWREYPKRMLKYRALGFLIRDFFGDALMGIPTREEAEDMPAIATTVIRREPEKDPLLEAALQGGDVPRGVPQSELDDAIVESSRPSPFAYGTPASVPPKVTSSEESAPVSAREPASSASDEPPHPAEDDIVITPAAEVWAACCDRASRFHPKQDAEWRATADKILTVVLEKAGLASAGDITPDLVGRLVALALNSKKP